jgi:16S rRNA (cytosine1402-N4)-methyltransferase
LLREVLAQLDLRPGLIVVDGTVGAGGHSHAIHSAIQPGGRLIGLDRDPQMLNFARQKLAGTDVELVHSPYSELRLRLDERGIAAADRVLLDLGLSSDQLSDESRGFGFDAGGPLDMRFDPTSGEPASDWLARVDAGELARHLRDHGEVPRAEELTDALVARRKRHQVRTTQDLIDVVDSVYGRSGKAKSPLAQVFQALRIAANRELEHLQHFLDSELPRCTQNGSLAAIISFHSVEDRLVKRAFTATHGWEPTTKKPIEATPAEARLNPRSRSARLRVAGRITDDKPRE